MSDRGSAPITLYKYLKALQPFYKYANFNKAFNFRGGFQVDTDTLVVRGPLVGIGSTIPQERLDVAENIKAESITLTSSSIGINSGN